MQRPRLLFYIHALSAGGAERAWADIACGLSTRGYPVTFAVDREAGPDAIRPPCRLRVEVIGPGHRQGIAALGRLLQTVHVDVAFAALGASNLKLLLAKARTQWTGAVVLSVHGFYGVESGLLGRLGHLGLGVLSRKAAMTVSVSHALTRRLVEVWRVPAGRIRTIHNGVRLPPAHVVPSAQALAGRDPLVLSAGRLVREKGFEDLIEAFAGVPQPARLMIAGTGPMEAALKALIARRGLEGRVTLAGYVEDMGALYAQARLFVLASHTEAFGNVIVEALSYGLPIVATATSGPKEILGQAGLGTIVPVGARAAMTGAIQAALGQPCNPAASRARAEEFSLERALDQYEALIAEVGARLPKRGAS